MGRPSRELVHGKAKCLGCLEWKLPEQFGKDNKQTLKISSYCRACKSDIGKNSYTKNRAKIRNQQRKSSYITKYGLDKADLNYFYTINGSRCNICLSEENLVIDHNHKTGELRGLLCATCNTGLGLFYDNLEYLKKAIGYLTCIQ